MKKRITAFLNEVELDREREEGYLSLVSIPAFSQPFPAFSRDYDALSPTTESERLMAGVILDLRKDLPEVAENIAASYHSMRKYPGVLEAFLHRAQWDFYSRDYSYLEPRGLLPGSEESFEAFHEAMLREACAESQAYNYLIRGVSKVLLNATEPEYREALEACLALSVYLRDNPKVLREMMERECVPTDEGNIRWSHFSRSISYLKDDIAPILDKTSPQGMALFADLLGKLRDMVESRMGRNHWSEWPDLPVAEALYTARDRGLSPLDLLEFAIRDDVYNREWALVAL